MNEIEKVFENAGIEPKKCWQSCMDCKEKTKTHYDEWGKEYLTCDRMEMDVENCPYAKKYYPIFTAEKQLELIKWLAKKFLFFAIEIDSKSWSCSTGIISGFYKKSLEESLADYINSIWQSLTESEKEKIRGILNGR